MTDIEIIVTKGIKSRFKFLSTNIPNEFTTYPQLYLNNYNFVHHLSTTVDHFGKLLYIC